MTHVSANQIERDVRFTFYGRARGVRSKRFSIQRFKIGHTFLEDYVFQIRDQVFRIVGRVADPTVLVRDFGRLKIRDQVFRIAGRVADPTVLVRDFGRLKIRDQVFRIVGRVADLDF